MLSFEMPRKLRWFKWPQAYMYCASWNFWSAYDMLYVYVFGKILKISSNFKFGKSYTYVILSSYLGEYITKGSFPPKKKLPKIKLKFPRKLSNKQFDKSCLTHCENFLTASHLILSRSRGQNRGLPTSCFGYPCPRHLSTVRLQILYLAVKFPAFTLCAQL